MLRKVLFGSIFIFLLICSTFGQRKDGDWTILDSGQSALGIEFRKDGTVYYENKLLMICPTNLEEPNGSEIQISTPSKTKKLIVVHCMQYFAESAALVVDTINKETITKDIVPPNWRLALWLNWSPNEDYLLMAAAGEVTNGDMFVVNLKTARSTEITFKKFIKNDEDELQELDSEKISWITSTKFSLVLDVKCNPYVLGERYCDRTKILRSQNAQVNISTLAITYGVTKTTTTRILPQKKTVVKKPVLTQNVNSPIRKINFKNATFKNVGAGKRTVVLLNGISSEISKDVEFFEDFEVKTEIASITYVDFDKDGNDEVVIKVSTRIDLGAGVYWEDDYFVSAYKDNKLTQIFHETRYRPQSFDIQGNKLVMKANIEAENDPNCCPSLTETSIYEWQNGEFILVSKTVTPSNQKTAAKATTTRNTTTQLSIRKVDFRNFSYLVTSVFLDKPTQIKTVRGKYLKGSRRNYDFWEFTVDKVIYGDLTGDGQEEALVLATIEQSGANPANSFDEGFYIYTLENAKPRLLGLFTRSDIWDAYTPYQNENDECDGWVWRTGGKIDNQKLIVESYVGGRQCVESGYDVTMIYVWNGDKFVLEGKPVKKKSEDSQSSTQPQKSSSIRKVDFRNFTYTNIKNPNEERINITVNKGKYIKGDQGSYNSWDFIINEVIYGDITNDGKEDALIRATLTTYGSSNPASLDSAYFFVYASENGVATKITDIDVWKDYEPFSNFQSGCEELILGAKIKAVSTGKATLNLLITGIECSHKGFTITSNYTWNDNRLTLVGKPIKTRTR